MGIITKIKKQISKRKKLKVLIMTSSNSKLNIEVNVD